MMLKLYINLGKIDTFMILFSHLGRWYIASIFLGLVFQLFIRFYDFLLSLYLFIKFIPKYFIVFVALITGLYFFCFCF